MAVEREMRDAADAAALEERAAEEFGAGDTQADAYDYGGLTPAQAEAIAKEREAARGDGELPSARAEAQISSQAAASESAEQTDVAAQTVGADSAETEQNAEGEDGSMSLTRHLEELRSRLIRCMIAVAVGSGVGYYFIDDIMHYLTLPAGKLYYMQPAEAFFTYLKVAVVVGFLLALPVIFFQVWRFFLPALTGKERLVLGIVVPVSVILFFIGLSFSFFWVLPAGIYFFMGFGNAELVALFSVDKYFDFVIAFVLPFGFVFELPLIITILGKMGIITSEFLKKYQRLVIFLSFVIGAIITPTPDVFTQSMIALPMIILYEIGYGIVKYILRK